jgi:hypothetical protein
MWVRQEIGILFPVQQPLLLKRVASAPSLIDCMVYLLYVKFQANGGIFRQALIDELLNLNPKLEKNTEIKSLIESPELLDFFFIVTDPESLGEMQK